MKRTKISLKYYVIIAVLLSAIAVFGVQINRTQAQDEQAIKLPPPLTDEPFAQDILSIRKADGEELYFNIELALTPRQQAQGLMYRTEMPEDSGMLFFFRVPRKLSFWMKNTLIPLDMVFVHPDGTIHHIHHNAKPQDETSITSKFPAKAVLELNGGTADKMGIKEGDQLIHRLFNNDAVKP
ncbi:MAG: DUF192 domain-containing protein [Rhodospirillales bacterium]|nr:DUF192 domain-containing protein [Rhodospirillales bacterium]